MTSEKVLVTGATGFTGGHLCQRLVREGYSVRAIVRDQNQVAGLRQQGIEVFVADLKDQRSLEVAATGVDVVYHIAALFRPENVSQTEMWETNVTGTRNMLDAAIKAGIRRFVHCSTVGVHGDVKDPPANEGAPYAPGDYYQRSKTEGERIVLEYMPKAKFPIIVFRPGGIYGPGDLRFLKLFRAIKNRTFVMLGSGQVIYQMIYIDDLIDGILLCGTNDKGAGNVFILTGDEPVTLNALVQAIAGVLDVSAPRWRFPFMPVYIAGFMCELVCKPLGIHPPLYRRRVDFFRKTRFFDISKAKRDLGFCPMTNLNQGLKTTADWYREAGYL